jgi:hypothetical protein
MIDIPIAACEINTQQKVFSLAINQRNSHVSSCGIVYVIHLCIYNNLEQLRIY